RRASAPAAWARSIARVTRSQGPISTEGGTRPFWAQNGHELFYVAPDGALMAVRVETRDRVWSQGRRGTVHDPRRRELSELRRLARRSTLSLAQAAAFRSRERSADRQRRELARGAQPSRAGE